MPASRNDPYRNFNFQVEINGQSTGDFSEVSGLGMEVGQAEYRSGADSTNSVRKLTGITKYTTVTLKRGVTKDLTFFNWVKNARDGVQDRRTVEIVLRDEAGQPVVRWKLSNAWPVKWTGPAFNARGDDVALESLELSYEGLDMIE